jgi:hypothetical protein
LNKRWRLLVFVLLRRVAAYPVILRFKFWRLNVFSAPTPNSVAAVVCVSRRRQKLAVKEHGALGGGGVGAAKRPVKVSHRQRLGRRLGALHHHGGATVLLSQLGVALNAANANFVATVYHRLPLKRDRLPIAMLQRPEVSFLHLIDAPNEGKA